MPPLRHAPARPFHVTPGQRDQLFKKDLPAGRMERAGVLSAGMHSPSVPQARLLTAGCEAEEGGPSFSQFAQLDLLTGQPHPEDLRARARAHRARTWKCVEVFAYRAVQRPASWVWTASRDTGLEGLELWLQLGPEAPEGPALSSPVGVWGAEARLDLVEAAIRAFMARMAAWQRVGRPPDGGAGLANLSVRVWLEHFVLRPGRALCVRCGRS